MIKGTAIGADGRTMLVFGLSRRNTEKLLAGQPIVVDTAEAMMLEGGPIVCIFAGENEKAMAEELAKTGAIDARTIIMDQSRQRDA